ncbi:MAG: hypothetical protein OEX81_01275 [Candidatus Pacebacteria bacterium]|nr:hypothetical protein [Candidatus Paceibacterota bacterium]
MPNNKEHLTFEQRLKLEIDERSLQRSADAVISQMITAEDKQEESFRDEELRLRPEWAELLKISEDLNLRQAIRTFWDKVGKKKKNGDIEGQYDSSLIIEENLEELSIELKFVLLYPWEEWDGYTEPSDHSEYVKTMNDMAKRGGLFTDLMGEWEELENRRYVRFRIRLIKDDSDANNDKYLVEFQLPKKRVWNSDFRAETGENNNWQFSGSLEDFLDYMIDAIIDYDEELQSEKFERGMPCEGTGSIRINTDKLFD